MTHTAWPLVVPLAKIENACAAEGGDFADAAVGPVPIPPPVTGWLGLFCVNTRDRVVALTFDDGPNPVHTPRVLDALGARGATATFFVLAGQVERHPELARRIVSEGHELALHGDDHTSLRTMSTSAAAASVRSAKRRVEAVTGTKLRRYRPPFGEYTPAQALAIRLLGLELVIWSGDSNDWRGGAEADILGRAAASVTPGGIVLMHDNRADWPSAEGPAPDYERGAVVAGLLDDLDTRGYRTMTVGGLSKTYQRVRSIARYGGGAR